LRVSCVVR